MGGNREQDPTEPGKNSLLTSTLLLEGQLIVGGARFTWWVVHGRSRRITVSHPLFGTRSGMAEGKPESVARALAEELLAGR
jgi:hypothetical protein